METIEVKRKEEQSGMEKRFGALNAEVIEMLKEVEVGAQKHYGIAVKILDCLHQAVVSEFLRSDQNVGKFYSMNLIGSTANSLCLSTHSDIDVVLLAESDQAEDDTIWCTDLKFVEHVFSIIRKAAESVGFAFIEQVMHSKVPVLKMRHSETTKEVSKHM